MALNQSVAENDIQVAHVMGKKRLSSSEKQQRIKKLRTSIAQEKVGSLRTISSIANTMIGSSIILYPVLFIQDGLLSSTLMMLVVGLVQYWTCAILCLHNKPREMDVNDTILRILGPKWYKANLITNVLLLYIVCVVYFLLISLNFYDLTGTFFKLIADFDPPKSSEITFKVYSAQWAGLIVMLIIYPLLFVKRIETLLKFLNITTYLVGVYMLFVLVFAFKNIFAGEVQWHQYVLFSSSFSNVAGAFALSFIIHPVVSPILKKNLHQNKNNRDLFLGYVATAAIYAFVGLFGAFACGKVVNSVIEDEYSTIFQCYSYGQEPNWIFFIAKAVQLCILLQNMSVFPILTFLTRQQFLEIINKTNPNQRLYYVFTVSLIFLALLVQMLNLNVAAVVSFDGAVVGFVLVYLIPVYMHWKCLYHSYTEEENDARKTLLTKPSPDDNTSVNSLSEIEQDVLECVTHPSSNKKKDKVLYSCIMTFGVAMGIFKILSFIRHS